MQCRNPREVVGVTRADGKVKRRFNAERGKQVWRVTGEGGAVANWRRGFGKRQTACWGAQAADDKPGM